MKFLAVRRTKKVPSILDLLTDRGADFKQHGDHHHASQGWIALDCPYCSPNWKRYRLGFEINTGRCSCWSCGGKRPDSTLALICNVPISVARKALGNKFLDDTFYEKHRGVLKEPKHIGPLQPPHQKYLQSRGFNPGLLEEIWGIKGISLAPKLQWRIYIPIFDTYGRQVSWTTRSIGDNTRRYVSASEEEEAVSHKEVLYGAHMARNTVIVVEGPPDAWAVGSGAVATLGTAVTKTQIMLLANYAVRVLCLDKDAVDRADKLASELSVFPGITEMVVLESGSDPASADKEELAELRQRYLEV